MLDETGGGSITDARARWPNSSAPRTFRSPRKPAVPAGFVVSGDIPSRYAWLAREPGPKMIVEALKLFGTLEKARRA
jgi:hypothetical protein